MLSAPMARNFITVANQSSPLRRGGRIPGPARPVAWVVSPGWSWGPTPRRTKCDTPRPGTTYANYVCAGPGGGGHSGATMVITALPCHCEGVRSTLKTLAYDCGNPVQYVCGHSPAVLFYLLDRHALLAMTMGSKCIFLYSLTTPRRSNDRHPPPKAVGILIFHHSYHCPDATYHMGRWAF